MKFADIQIGQVIAVPVPFSRRGAAMSTHRFYNVIRTTETQFTAALQSNSKVTVRVRRLDGMVLGDYRNTFAERATPAVMKEAQEYTEEASRHIKAIQQMREITSAIEARRLSTQQMERLAHAFERISLDRDPQASGPKLPLRVGTYDDAGMVVDATGAELFSVGQNEDTRSMDDGQQALARWILQRLNNPVPPLLREEVVGLIARLAVLELPGDGVLDDGGAALARLIIEAEALLAKLQSAD